MSRYRKIHVRMWGDEKFKSLSHPPPNGQSLWIYLLTGPHTGPIPGIFSAGEAAMAESLEWPLKGFREAFREVFVKGMAKADWKVRLVFVPKALKYNQPESPNVVKSWRHAFDELPECRLKVEIYQYLKGFTEGLPEAFNKAFVEALPEAYPKAMPNQEQEQDIQEQEQEKIEDNTSHFTKAKMGRSKGISISLDGDWPSVQALVYLYNEKAPDECPAVEKVSKAREKRIRQHLHQFSDKEFWEEVFAEIHKSPFLRGLKPSDGHEHFRANLDWLLTKGKDGVENCVKVFEGRYRP